MLAQRQGIVGRQHALDHDGTVPEPSEPLEIAERHGGIEQRVGLCDEIRACRRRRGSELDRLGGEHAPHPLRMTREADRRAKRHARRELESGPDVSQPLTCDRHVDGEHQHPVPRSAGPFDDRRCGVAVAPEVQLEPAIQRGCRLCDRLG